MKWDNYRAKVYQKDDFRIILRLQPRLQRLQPNALMEKKISAGIITVFDGNETDPEGETLQAQDTNLTSSDEKPYMLMVLILQVQGHQELAKRRDNITADGTTELKRM